METSVKQIDLLVQDYLQSQDYRYAAKMFDWQRAVDSLTLELSVTENYADSMCTQLRKGLSYLFTLKQQGSLYDWLVSRPTESFLANRNNIIKTKDSSEQPENELSQKILISTLLVDAMVYQYLTQTNRMETSILFDWETRTRHTVGDQFVKDMPSQLLISLI
eukprot:Filipodium_phascolosomae@DN5926_c0_g1_i1.p1